MSRDFSNTITITKNSRGVYNIDPSIGCSSGIKENINGCYGECYANKILRGFGYNFNKTIFRDFKNKKHLQKIRNTINKPNIKYVRMGTFGDPSENWEHTISICEKLQKVEQLNLFDNSIKPIIIVTKHWNNLTISQLKRIKNLNLIFNTSISALDNKEKLNNSILQYETLKDYCKSTLRIVSFDFNVENEIGLNYFNIQKELFNNYKMIDTVFRSSLTNSLVKDKIINVSKHFFLTKDVYVSKFNKNTHLGNCNNCPDKCGFK